MTQINRLLLRVAMDIHKYLQISAPAKPLEIELPESQFRRCEMLLHTLRRASQIGFPYAAQRLRRELCSTTGQLRRKLLEMESQLAEPQTECNGAAVRDIYADLLALHQEFDELEVDRRNHMVSVTTEAIELNGVYLGPFEICLDWSRPPQSGLLDYRVVAQEPHPAASDPDVTHPHVQHESVCEGDGKTAIHSALRQGRLLDFFTIVANLLRTYNAASPYVSLSEWNGFECEDCGKLTCDDERSRCEKCETALCDGCCQPCASCGNSQCDECVSRCNGCDDPHCDSCLRTCEECNDEYCENCLEDQKCQSCHDESEQDTATSETGSLAATSVAV